MLTPLCDVRALQQAAVSSFNDPPASIIPAASAAVRHSLKTSESHSFPASHRPASQEPPLRIQKRFKKNRSAAPRSRRSDVGFRHRLEAPSALRPHREEPPPTNTRSASSPANSNCRRAALPERSGPLQDEGAPGEEKRGGARSSERLPAALPAPQLLEGTERGD